MERQHYHEGYEIYLQLGGERNVFFAGHKYILKRGSLFIIEPFVLHMTTNSEAAVCSRNILNFRRDALAEFLSDKEIDSLFKRLKTCIIQLNETQLHVIKEQFEELGRQWIRYSRGKERHCEKLAYIEIYRLLDKILYLTEKHKDIINLSLLEIATNTDIFRVIKYIEEHYAESITLSDVVEYSHMSQASFYRVFKKTTGDTFANYLSRYRLSRAHKLIAETNLSLGEIANMTGFSSTAHMSRIFRQQYGMSPSHFRK